MIMKKKRVTLMRKRNTETFIVYQPRQARFVIHSDITVIASAIINMKSSSYINIEHNLTKRKKEKE